MKGIRAISFDFGNTLVPFPGQQVDGAVAAVANEWAPRLGTTAPTFTGLWAEERARQLREDVPEGREADLDIRVARILARLGGVPAPPDGERWDADLVASHSPPGEVEGVLETYARAFVELVPVPAAVGPMLARLARRYRLAVVSNWPLAIAVERYLANAGWADSLSAVVVSQKVGAIKPQPRIFQVAAQELAVECGPAILHVGDDLAADVVGAQAVGWRAAWIRMRPPDSPLPKAAPVDFEVHPDLTIDTATDLERALRGRS